jgi:hypothetical protein
MRSSAPHAVQTLLLAAFALAGCTQPRVVNEGAGWKETEGKDVGKTAVEITSDDPKTLAELAKNHPDARVRAEALAKITDPDVLADVARREKDPAIRKRAVEGVEDPVLLEAIAKSDSDAAVQEAAAARRDLLRTVGPRHPEYASWSAFKPGAWVKIRMEIRIKDWRTTVDVTRKLVVCRPERVVLEQKDLSTGKGISGFFKDMLSGFDHAVGRTQESDGELEIGGKKVKCKWTKWTYQRGHDIVNIRRWFHDPIPGGVARIDLEVSPEGEPLKTLVCWVIGWGN